VKIGLVLDDTLDTPDGVQQYVIGVGNWLSANGHEVHYLVGHTIRTDINNIHSLSRNIKVRFNGNRMSMPLPTSKSKLRAFLAEHKFDVLHVQLPYSPFMAGRLLQVAPSETAVVGTFHILPNSSVARFANRLLALMNARSAKRFDVVMAASEPARIFAKQVYGLSDRTVPNPIKLAQFAGARGVTTTTNIVFLGRLVQRKGSLQLLRAIAYLREHQLSTQEFKVIIGGKGELLDKLQSFADKHNLHDIVRFAGFIGEAEKAQFLAEADLAVYPSTGGESFGIVLLEGMAAARGVVLAGNNPGYSSVMGELKDQIIDPNDMPAFAGQLAKWLDDPEARQAAAQAQHEYVKRFDIAVVGATVERVYNEALQKRANP